MHHIKNAAIFRKEFNFDGRYLILTSLPNDSFIIKKKRTESWLRVPTIPSCIWFQRNAGADIHHSLIWVWSRAMVCKPNFQPCWKFPCVLRIEINSSSCCTEYRSSFAIIMSSPNYEHYLSSTMNTLFFNTKEWKGWIVNPIY